jgi:hypothetical protein
MDDLSKQLDIYKKNYAKYRLYGDLSAKSIADTALAAADDIIEREKKLYENGEDYLRKFVDKIKDSSPDLIDLHKRSAVLHREVPELQDEYIQTKILNEAPITESIDYTPYLVKGGIVAGLLLITGLASIL